MGRKLTHEIFIQRVKETAPNITPRGIYTGVFDRMDFECDKGHIWNTTPNSIFHGSNCPACAITNSCRTLEDVQLELDEVNPGYKIIGEYKNTMTKTEVLCPNGHIFMSKSNTLLQGHGCPICKRIDPCEFEKRFYDAHPMYKLISNFVDSKTKIRIECDKGHQFEMLPYNSIKGQGCPCCKGEKISEAQRKTQYQYELEVALMNPTFKVIGEYQGANYPIDIMCENGHIWSPTAGDVCYNKRECPVCHENRIHDEFVSALHEINPEITVLGKYKNMKTDIKVSCKNGHIWETEPRFLISGCGCFECFNIARTKKHDDFVKELREKNPDLKVIGTYSGARVKIDFECNDGHIFQCTPDSALRGSYCPVCMSSKGERRIARYLDDNSISYKKYMEYDGLLGTGGGNLSYDFYIPSINLLIEYHGIQHEKPVDFKGLGEKYAQEAFEKQVEHDRRKGEYAQNHKIPLLVIWYYDFDNIETILTNYISKAAQADHYYFKRRQTCSQLQKSATT